MTAVKVNTPESVIVGDEFDVPIAVDQVTNFDAGMFDIDTDKSLIELVSINDGDIGGTVIPVSIWAEISEGVYRILVNVPGFPGVTGSGSFAVLRFKGLDPGDALIDISNGFINDNEAQEIPAEWDGGLVKFFRPGDANGDGVVDAADITLIERIIVGLEPYTPAADANRDGKLNTADITTVERMIAGL